MPEKKHLLAIRKGCKSEIFTFGSKHDRAMALDSMARRDKVHYSFSTIGKKKKKKY